MCIVCTDGVCFMSKVNQKKQTKGGVKRRRKPFSLARLDRSCIGNTLLDTVNGTSKCSGVCAYGN